MFDIIRLGETFIRFLRDELVPFLTVPPEFISFPIYDPVTQTLEYFSIPWFLGDTSIAEFILFGGLIFMLGFKIVKFFLDVIF